MQQIERYGIIALVLLLVTIVAVSFWGERGGGGLWSRITGRGKPAVLEQRKDPALAAEAVRRSMGEDLPLSTPTASPTVAPEVSLVADLGPGSAAGLGVPAVLPLADALPAAAEVSEPAIERGPRYPRTRPEEREAIPLARAKPETTGATGRVYVVQKGDSLSAIAQKTLGSAKRWPEIRALNPSVDPARLSVGTKLALPGSASASPVASSVKGSDGPRAVVAAAPAKSRTCTVHKGDTLSRIAERELGSSGRWREIAAANPGLDPSRLKVGAVLKLPNGQQAGGQRAGGTGDGKAAQDAPLVASSAAPSALPATSKGGDGPKVR